jgi:hypothetical protein
MNPDLTPTEVEYILKNGCDDLGAAGIDNTFGYGRINIYESLLLVHDPLDFYYPNGRPDMIDPAGGTMFEVEVLPKDSTPKADSGTLYYNDGTGYTSVAMNYLGNNMYQAVFPAFDCGANIDYYISAESTDNEIVTDPGSAPDTAFSALAAIDLVEMFSDDYESDYNYTTSVYQVSAGGWTRGVPVANGGRGAPTSDFDGSGQCWVTGNTENVDLDGGPAYTVTPNFTTAGCRCIHQLRPVVLQQQSRHRPLLRRNLDRQRFELVGG